MILEVRPMADSCWCLVEINTICKARGFPGSSAGKESACNAGDLGSIPGLGRSPGERHGNPLQSSCLENPMDSIVHGSLTQWTWVWPSSGSWWWTGRPGVPQSVGSQRARQEWETELNWFLLEPNPLSLILNLIFSHLMYQEFLSLGKVTCLNALRFVVILP